MSAIILIDPINHQIANMTFKALAQQVRMQQIRVPFSERLFQYNEEQHQIRARRYFFFEKSNWKI